MTPFIKRNLLIPLSILLFAGLLYALVFVGPAFGHKVQHLEFIIISIMIGLSLVIMLFWSMIGVFGGLLAFLITLIFLYKPLTGLDPYYYGVLILAFFINSYAGYFFSRKINTSSQKYKVTKERVMEDTNLISNHFKNRELEVSAMADKIDSLMRLKDIADNLSLSLAEEDAVVRLVVEKTFDIFDKNSRVMLFMVPKDAADLSLVHAIKGERRLPVSNKMGDIFDNWVKKNMKSLLVRDIKKDFRFNVEENDLSREFTSLISKPLVLEGKVLGIIRVDSVDESAYTQHDLRILDIIGELAAVAVENARLYKKTEDLAIRDSLTGLYVHRYFMDRLGEEVKRSLVSNNRFAMIMMDIDNFKDFNDKYGHISGDRILKKIGKVLQSKSSAGDIVARYGGEEFAFLALNTGRKEAVRIANDLREKIAASPVTIRREKKGVTISMGVAIFPDDAKMKEDIIGEADRRLYKAKEKGKNKVCSK